jgi:glucose/arabinose dehydrogenase
VWIPLPRRRRADLVRATLAAFLSSLAVLLAVSAAAPRAAHAATLPPGFSDNVVFSGLTNPTSIRFASDGRVFVAEKGGLVKVFDSLTDPSPSVFVDLSTNVQNFWDRGLLGLALAPNFPTDPYVYVLYTYDHQLSGGPVPRWGDQCPNPPGATTDGCVVSARLSRFQASGNSVVGGEQVLVEDWCQQYPSHSVGDLAFGPDGALYATGGDGASFTFTDWGQDGSPVNPCGDPPGGVGGSMTPPTAEGGMLRSQDMRTPGDPTTLDGSLIRVDPATGLALPSNPNFGSSDPNARRIIAYGMRNPFRFAFRPGTSEIWLGDVGWNDWEEINRVLDPDDSVVENFGWPCYEGQNKQSALDAANLNICENLYAQPSADTKPYFAYHHSAKVVTNESCPTGSSSISGISFEFSSGSSPYPTDYKDALFFADYSRDCIWVMKKGNGNVPAPGLIETLVAGATNPVSLERGRDGKIYYPDFDTGTIHRIDFSGSTSTPPSNNTLPTLSGQATVGSTLTVQPGTWSGTQPITLAYQWRRCDSAGANCANITGATGTTYAVVAGDLGSTLRVRESASNSAGSAFADSAQSAVVTQGSPSAYRDAVVADSPFLYWRLGEASGTFADSSTGGANPGTASGTGLSRNVANLVTANSDGALAFTDATTNIATTTAITGLPTSTVSTEVWFKAAGFANSIDLVNHGYGATGGNGWAMWLNAGGSLNFGLWQSGGTQQVVVSSPLSANTTYHAVGTYDGNVMRLYVNGAQVATKTVGALALNTSAGFFTGRTDTTSTVTIDELALYPTALSAARVQAHYTASGN